MKTSNLYAKTIKQQLGYLATWLPGTPLALGDIGILKKNKFNRIGRLEDLEVDFTIRTDETKEDIEHSTEGGHSITTKLAGALSPPGSSLLQADAGIIIEFLKEKAIIFKATGATSPSIENQIELANNIIELFQQGKWNKDWVVITELVHAESTSVIIANSSQAKIELKVNAEGALPLVLNIGNADLKLAPVISKDLLTEIIATEALTPLFKASKLKSKLFAPPVFETSTMRLHLNGINNIDLMTPDAAKKSPELLFLGEAGFQNEDTE